MTSEGEHLPGMDRAAIALAAWLKRSDLRNRLAEGGSNGIKSLARSFAHEFQTSTYFEFLKERRDVEFDGAFGEVEFVGNFLVGQAAKDSVENFFFTAGEAHRAFGAVAGFEQPLSLVGQFAQTVRRRRNHHQIVFGALTADHAMHGQQPGSVIDRKFTSRAGLHVEMSRTSAFLIKQVNAGLG